MGKASTMHESLSANQVQHVAKLSRLKLSESDIERYRKQLSGILDYVAQLQEVDVADQEPMSHPLPLHSVMRDDVVEPSLPITAVLQNAPSKSGAFFTVPKVLDPSAGGG